MALSDVGADAAAVVGLPTGEAEDEEAEEEAEWDAPPDAWKKSRSNSSSV